MRVKHYIKNGLIFIPLIFSGQLFDTTKLWHIVAAAVVFSIITSIVYIINDIQDAEKDRLHVKKKNRPIASGLLSIKYAIILVIVLAAASTALGVLTGLNVLAWTLLALYVGLNVGYSFGLKNIPIIDVAILASGFVIRVFYGADAVDIVVSNWLYLTVLAGAFYLALGKRRNELRMLGVKSRKVNEYYSLAFLDKNMYVCLALLLVFYSLWATGSPKYSSLFWTIPIVILIFMSYSLSVEKEESVGDPVDVLMNNKVLLVFIVVYIFLTVGLLYLW